MSTDLPRHKETPADTYNHKQHLLLTTIYTYAQADFHNTSRDVVATIQPIAVDYIFMHTQT